MQEHVSPPRKFNQSEGIKSEPSFDDDSVMTKRHPVQQPMSESESGVFSSQSARPRVTRADTRVGGKSTTSLSPPVLPGLRPTIPAPIARPQTPAPPAANQQSHSAMPLSSPLAQAIPAYPKSPVPPASLRVPDPQDRGMRSASSNMSPLLAADLTNEVQILKQKMEFLKRERDAFRAQFDLERENALRVVAENSLLKKWYDFEHEKSQQYETETRKLKKGFMQEYQKTVQLQLEVEALTRSHSSECDKALRIEMEKQDLLRQLAQVQYELDKANTKYDMDRERMLKKFNEWKARLEKLNNRAPTRVMNGRRVRLIEAGPRRTIQHRL